MNVQYIHMHMQTCILNLMVASNCGIQQPYIGGDNHVVIWWHSYDNLVNHHCVWDYI